MFFNIEIFAIDALQLLKEAYYKVFVFMVAYNCYFLPFSLFMLLT